MKYFFCSCEMKLAGSDFDNVPIVRLRGITSSVHYFTTLPVIFGVQKYAAVLTDIVKARGINLHLRYGTGTVGTNHHFCSQCFGSGFAWIRNKFDSLIRIRIRNTDPDPGSLNFTQIYEFSRVFFEDKSMKSPPVLVP